MMLCLEIILIEKVNEKPALESVCKYLCIEYTLFIGSIYGIAPYGSFGGYKVLFAVKF